MARTYYVTANAAGGGNGLSPFPNGGNAPFTLIEGFTTGIVEPGSTIKIINSGSYANIATSPTIVCTGHATGWTRWVGVDYVNHQPIPLYVSGMMATGSLPTIRFNSNQKISSNVGSYNYTIWESLNFIGNINDIVFDMGNHSIVKDCYIENQGGTAYFSAYCLQVNTADIVMNCFLQSDTTNSSTVKLNASADLLYNNLIWSKGATSGACGIFSQQSGPVHALINNTIIARDGVVFNVGAFLTDVKNTYIVTDRAHVYNHASDHDYLGFILDGIVCDAIRSHDAVGAANTTKPMLNINTLENRVSNGAKGGAFVATGLQEISSNVSTTGLFLDLLGQNFGSSITSPAFRRSYVYNSDIGSRQANRGGRASHL